MKNFKRANNLTGWVAFIIAAVTYLLTIEPTASFWDCGEFISSAFKLDVGHPPGAPFFMLIGRFFANFASKPEMVAMMMNTMSAMFSALTILFLFWTITHLTRKVLVKNEKDMTTGEIITILGAGLVGALAYTFSDTFWFSAVEGEVYAFSSLFTAVVFWAMLKWEDVAEEAHSERWIIFIAYLMGLSIGVHLLNLLCIPALVLIYYFKKSPKITTKGVLLALLASVGLIGVVLYGIVPGFVNMAGWSDLLFVNILGFSFNSGAIFYLLVVVATIAWGLYETFSGKSPLRMKIAFCVNIILVGIPFLGNSPVVWILLCGAVIALTFLWKGINPHLINTVLLSLMVMLIGYSSYGITVIRSNAQPPMDQNSPDNMFSLESYLNREQYGETPLIYGESFASDISWNVQGSNCVPVYKKKGPIWGKKAKDSKDEKDSYVIAGYNERPVMAPECNMFFPRMYSKVPAHVQGYKMWSNFKGRTVTIDHCGQQQAVQQPTMVENLTYFIEYQVNFMYWRYFMWNFSGRQNDIQGSGEIENGNWITGINFIDQLRVGNQSNLSPEMENNKGHNKYYLLPLLLGILGIVFQLSKGDKGVQYFWITFMLFFMTGLAIVLYLNQTPMQPRERDYAYAGSFYAFAIWIGLGVPMLVRAFKKILPESPSAIAATLLCLGVPVLMASENWNDHDRSNRYTCRDFAYNYLASCDKNAIIFTNGDNDTFPLWYLQEVEGIRPDVRVCNLSYLQTDWYVSQMRRPYYESEALPIKWKQSMYSNGKRDIGRIIKLTEDSISLDMAMQFIETDDDRYKRIPGYDEKVDFIPSSKVYMKINPSEVVSNNYIGPKFADRIIPQLNINFGDRTYLGKQQLMILEMLQENKWKRPIYYAATVEDEQFMGLQASFIQEGLTYKVAPVKSEDGQPIVDTDKMYDRMMNQFRFGNIQDPKVYLDENNLRMCRSHRHMFTILSNALYKEGKLDKVEKVLDYCLKVIPVETVPANASNVDMATMYYRIGKPEKARALIQKCSKNILANLDWAYSLTPRQYASASELVRMNLISLDMINNAMNTFDKKNAAPYFAAFQKHASLFQQVSAMSSSGMPANQ